MSEVDYNPMPNALTHRNFLGAKKKATQEETWKPEPVPFPVYKKADNIVNNVGWRNLLRSLKP